MNRKRADDASKIGALADILASANKVKEVPTTTPNHSPAPPIVETTQAEAPPRRRGPIGKSSDPTYKFAGVYLKKTTQKRTKRRLDDLETGQDFSELVEQLLNQWLDATD